jgi:hypothetical protein
VLEPRGTHSQTVELGVDLLHDRQGIRGRDLDRLDQDPCDAISNA